MITVGGVSCFVQPVSGGLSMLVISFGILVILDNVNVH